MLALQDWLLLTVVLLCVHLLILIDKWHQIDRANLHEDDLAVLKLSAALALDFLHDATFTNLEWLVDVLAADLNVALFLSFESD